MLPYIAPNINTCKMTRFDKRSGIVIPTDLNTFANKPLVGDKNKIIIPHITIVEIKCGK